MALSTNFTQCAPKTTKFGKITQNKGHFAVRGHSRSPIFAVLYYKFLIQSAFLQYIALRRTRAIFMALGRTNTAAYYWTISDNGRWQAVIVVQ